VWSAWGESALPTVRGARDGPIAHLFPGEVEGSQQELLGALLHQRLDVVGLVPVDCAAEREANVVLLGERRRWPAVAASRHIERHVRRVAHGHAHHHHEAVLALGAKRVQELGATADRLVVDGLDRR